MRQIISFDLDGTLADLNFEKTVWLEEVPRLFAKKNSLPLDQAKAAVFAAYDMIGMDDINWYDIKFWFKEFGLQDDYAEILRGSSHLIKLYPETIPVLKNLQKHFQLIVISNATREFINFKLGVENLEKYFSHVFSTTSDFKSLKGNSQGYLDACKRLGVEPGKLIHIGDDYEFDYLAAKRVGIDAYYLDRKKKPVEIEEGRKVSTLKDFEKLMIKKFG